jgi:hypothetical protein
MPHTNPEREAERRTPGRVQQGNVAQPGGTQLRVAATRYFGEYHGHTVEDLKTVVASLRSSSSSADPRAIIWLSGDSTLDNKYWLPLSDQREACNGYERVLSPPRMQPDVSYCMNDELVQRGLGDAACSVNCAIEESTLGVREDELLPQDCFLRDNLRPLDVVVVSIGGNDIALRPTPWTVAAMAALLMSPRALIPTGWAPGTGHFVRLFRDETQRLLERLTARQRPRRVVVCMLYYLDEAQTDSWAGATLKTLGYNSDPTKLQLLMRTIFALATSQVRLDGVEVVPLPLYEALDGKDPCDYVQRVEPSAQGGAKMARAILDRAWPRT